MAIWLETQDPTSQAESRRVPLSSGIIDELTSVRIPATLFRDLRRASPEAQNIFDAIAMRMSHVFPGWKGTRIDFRFADEEDTRVFVLTPGGKSIRVEIRTDVTGYIDRNNLFSTAPSEGSGYPGTWLRANVEELAEATAIVDDVERAL